jgi:branched-chain amino acid transport system permease protein
MNSTDATTTEESAEGTDTHPADGAATTGPRTRLGAFLAEHNFALGALFCLFLFALPFVFVPSTLFSITLVFIYGMLAFSTILPIGYAGQLILCQGAFFGIGAYTFVTATDAGAPAPLSVVLAIGLTAAVAYALGRPAMKTGGIYLGILTLAFNELFTISLNLFSGLSGGSEGLSSPSLVPDSVFGVVPSEVLQYYLTLVVFAGTFVVFRQVLGSETGWAFLTIKEDRTIAESLGIDSTNYRLRAFTLAGAVCGLAGGLYAPITGYITPTAFTLESTIDIILTGVLGGLTTPLGSVFGAMVVVLLPEVLRFVEDFRLIIYGALLIGLLIYLPDGIGGWLQRRL